MWKLNALIGENNGRYARTKADAQDKEEQITPLQRPLRSENLDQDSSPDDETI